MTVAAGAEFEVYGAVHWLGLGLTVFLIASSIVFRRRLSEPTLNRKVRIVLALLMLLNEILFQVFEAATDNWTIESSLRLHMCQMTTFITAYVLFTLKPVPFQVIYFWTTSGLVHGLITPDLEPHEPYHAVVDFFVYHGGNIVAVVFLLATTSLRPTFRGIWIATATALAFMVAMAGLNYVLGVNYWFLCEKPVGDNLTNILPAWPWYLLVFVPLGIAHYIVAWLPWGIAAWRQARQDEDRRP